MGYGTQQYAEAPYGFRTIIDEDENIMIALEVQEDGHFEVDIT